MHDANIGLKEGTILRIPQNFIEILTSFTQWVLGLRYRI
jgi:hypothetical protein